MIDLLKILKTSINPTNIREKIRVQTTQVLIPVVNNVRQKTSQSIKNWFITFRQASPKQRWTMVRIPVFVICLFLFIINFGSLFIPPKITTSFPGNNGSEAPLDTKIDIIFDRGMIKPLVEKTFSISPNITGSFSWEGDQKFTFTPSTKLQRAQTYRVNFNGILLSKFLIPLLGTKTITFGTIGNPKIVLASPQAEALEDLSPITVVFDRPMIPLTTFGNNAAKKPAFTITPEITGEGRWLGTTAYQFRPSVPFTKATTYKVTIPAGMHSQDEGIMDKEYIWQFSSERPHVLDISPTSGYNFASPVASISAKFNETIDYNSATEKFLVYDKMHNKVSGRIVVTGNEVGFYPLQPLNREENYNVDIVSGLKSTEGPNGLEADYSWSFNTAAKPTVLSTTPANGDKNINEQNQVQVLFKTPMDENSFDGNILISPQPSQKPSFYFSTYNGSNTLSINTYFGRSQTYTITINPGVKDQYGTTLDTPYVFQFVTAPYKPAIGITPNGTYFGAFNQQIIPRVVAQVVNANRIDYTLYKLKREDFLDLYRRHYEEQCRSDNDCRNWQNYNTQGLQKIRSWSETYESDNNTPVNVVTKVTTESGDKIPPGLYYLDLKIPQGPHDNMVMIVTKSALTVKKSDTQVFTWAVDQSSANVIPGMQMQLIDSAGNVLGSGNTNNDGVYMQNVDLFQKNNLFVFGNKGDDVTIASTSWNNGISSYDFGLPTYYNSNEQKDYNVKQSYKLFLVLDRPIYRPGQKVYFKGVIRKDNDGAYENLPPGEQVSVTINDAQNRPVNTQALSITTSGSFSGDFTLSKDASLGYYQIGSTYQGNTFSQQFQVEEYKKPDLAVTVKPSKDAYSQGENATVTINASYYFGAPVTQSPVTWTLQTQDYSFRWDKDWRFEFGDPDSYWSQPWWYYTGSSYFAGQKVTEGKGTTDANGNLEVNIPLDISRKTTSQQMVLEATVNDINNQSIAASKEFTVHKSGLYVGLRPESYANQSGQSAQVEIVTVDLNGKEIPNTPVAIEFYKRTWDTIREQNPDDGLFYYTSKPSDSLVSSTTVTTDSLGRVVASFTPDTGGTYKVVGKVTDSKGNQNISGSFLWVSGLGFSTARENNDRIVVVTDKRDYMVGDNLSVFVASPFASDSAKTLLTAERGSVLDYKVVDTSATSNNFTMSVSPKLTPNAFIGAVLVKGGDQVKNPPEFKIGYTQVKVTDKKQQIDVRITTDQKRYKPGDTLNATIETLDLLGHPITSEIAVGLVDKAVWDLSRVEFPDIYKTFYQPRNLGVSTSQLLTISIDRINANTNLGAKGGSGGGGGGGPDTTRTNFPDTAYWNPYVKTDKNGKAYLKIKLPDNLTTWRFAAIANSQEAAFGSNVAEVVVSRDVLIRPFLPRFLSVGDQAQLGAIVVNTSGSDQTLNVSIEGDGIEIKENKTKPLVLADGAEARITWLTSTKNTDNAKIKLTVLKPDNTVMDSLVTSLPVKSYSVPEVVATSGQAKDTAQEAISLPGNIDPSQGKATITYSPSLGAASIDSLSYLFTYPYYCVEQITSKFLPAVFVHRIFTNAKIDKSGSINAKELEMVINDGIQRLNNQQHSDGGWGWWTEYESDPFITAYAFLGLTEAKKDNFTVADQTIQKAQDYLATQLSRGSNTSLSTQAYILYVLRGRKVNVSSYAANLFERRFELSLEARAYLAMAMRDLGMGSQAQRLYDELLSLAKKTATTTHWEESKIDYSFMGSNTTATASILETIIQFDKNNPLIPEIVRYLMTIRSDNHWASTRDTAAVIKAISSQFLNQGDQSVDENYRLLLNGKVLKEGKFGKNDLLNFEQYILSISNFSIGNNNKLQITKSGTGNLYYNVDLKYYLPFSVIQPMEQGIVVVREFVDSKGNILSENTINENTEEWVRLIIVTPAERHFVMIEDTLPAGLEAVNESLKNVSVLNSKAPGLKQKGDQFLYFYHKEYHDDRTTMFANYLPAGVYEVTYRVRATTPGTYHYPPAQAYQMYVPDVSGHSDGGWLEVKSTVK